MSYASAATAGASVAAAAIVASVTAAVKHDGTCEDVATKDVDAAPTTAVTSDATPADDILVPSAETATPVAEAAKLEEKKDDSYLGAATAGLGAIAAGASVAAGKALEAGHEAKVKALAVAEEARVAAHEASLAAHALAEEKKVEALKQAEVLKAQAVAYQAQAVEATTKGEFRAVWQVEAELTNRFILQRSNRARQPSPRRPLEHQPSRLSDSKTRLPSSLPPLRPASSSTSPRPTRLPTSSSPSPPRTTTSSSQTVPPPPSPSSLPPSSNPPPLPLPRTRRSLVPSVDATPAFPLRRPQEQTERRSLCRLASLASSRSCLGRSERPCRGISLGRGEEVGDGFRFDVS